MLCTTGIADTVIARPSRIAQVVNLEMGTLRCLGIDFSDISCSKVTLNSALYVRNDHHTMPKVLAHRTFPCFGSTNNLRADMRLAEIVNF